MGTLAIIAVVSFAWISFLFQLIVRPDIAFCLYPFADSGEIILPSQLAINGCNVSMAGDEENLRRMCENVTELDLTDNRITDWHEVSHLVISMVYIVVSIVFKFAAEKVLNIISSNTDIHFCFCSRCLNSSIPCLTCIS